jgi:protocatechuate 3,4-dioxygenase beta subunit
MKREKFLSLVGLSMAGTAFLSGKKHRDGHVVAELTDCNDPITPPVPEGPYYKNEKLMRMDITEASPGTAIDYVIRVEDEHCKPVREALVDIWQCDAHGRYSDFSAEKTEGQTWLRGMQHTDEHGVCRFNSIFPGWYDGRITHLHVKVHVDGKTMLTTNFFFPKSFQDEIYASPLYPKGPNPVTIQQDAELHVDKDAKRHDTLLMKMERNSKGSLVASYTVAVG